MAEPIITIVLNGNTYRLNASDPKSISKIPQAERCHLITLLEAVRREEKLSDAVVQRAINKAKFSSQAASSSVNPTAIPGVVTPKPERLGSGDVDALMSRLILEEKQNQKPGLTTTTIYKWAGGIVAAIILIVLIF